MCYMPASFIQICFCVSPSVLMRSELALFLSNSDLNRLAQYARNMIDHHLITDLLPTLAYLYFDDQFDEKVFYLRTKKMGTNGSLEIHFSPLGFVYYISYFMVKYRESDKIPLFAIIIKNSSPACW